MTKLLTFALLVISCASSWAQDNVLSRSSLAPGKVQEKRGPSKAWGEMLLVVASQPVSDNAALITADEALRAQALGFPADGIKVYSPTSLRKALDLQASLMKMYADIQSVGNQMKTVNDSATSIRVDLSDPKYSSDAELLAWAKQVRASASQVAPLRKSADGIVMAFMTKAFCSIAPAGPCNPTEPQLRMFADLIGQKLAPEKAAQ